MPFPDHLLEQTQLLANLDKKRPRQASLRKGSLNGVLCAVSSPHHCRRCELEEASPTGCSRPRLRTSEDERRMYQNPRQTVPQPQPCFGPPPENYRERVHSAPAISAQS